MGVFHIFPICLQDYQHIQYDQLKLLERVAIALFLTSPENTYMTGWGLDLPTQKNHLKILRNKLSCSGSCKKKKIDNTEKIVFHLQGDHVITLKEYLISLGMNDVDIKIKGR